MTSRRQILSGSAQVASLLVTAGVLPKFAFAQSTYNTGAFDAKSLAGVVTAMGGQAPVLSKDVAVTGPDIAENGAVVPIGASTTLTGVKRMLILVEKNPSVLSASFDVTDAVDANFGTRVKMGQSSNVYAVALMNDGKVFYAQREVKVTLGGCGG